MRRKPKRYPWELYRAVEARIPKEIHDALAKFGWNVLGVYEVVEEELRRWKKHDRCGGSGQIALPEGGSSTAPPKEMR